MTPVWSKIIIPESGYIKNVVLNPAERGRFHIRTTPARNPKLYLKFWRQDRSQSRLDHSLAHLLQPVVPGLGLISKVPSLRNLLRTLKSSHPSTFKHLIKTLGVPCFIRPFFSRRQFEMGSKFYTLFINYSRITGKSLLPRQVGRSAPSTFNAHSSPYSKKSSKASSPDLLPLTIHDLDSFEALNKEQFFFLRLERFPRLEGNCVINQ